MEHTLSRYSKGTELDSAEQPIDVPPKDVFDTSNILKYHTFFNKPLTLLSSFFTVYSLKHYFSYF